VTEYVLGVDLLLALAWPQHEQHGAAHRWFAAEGRHAWATCPVSQLEFVRLSCDRAVVPDAARLSDAVELLRDITALPGHRFWRDNVTICAPILLDGAARLDAAHVLPAYLIELARRNEAVLATFDELLPDLAASLGVHRDVVQVVPIGA